MITQEAAGLEWLFFLHFSEGKSRISFAVEKHITSLQTVYSHICGLLISKNVLVILGI